MTVLAIAALLMWLLALGMGLGVLWAPGVVSGLRRLLGTVLFGALGALLVAVLLLFQSCLAFSNKTLVARVEARRLAADAFELVYTPVGRESAVPQTVSLRGDQWAISGGIIKWHPWLTAMGVKNYHRPMRLSGQFSRIDRPRAEPATVYPLSNGSDRLWELLYRIQRYLPFVEAVYGSSAYTYVEPTTPQAVYVTSSGYLIKPAK